MYIYQHLVLIMNSRSDDLCTLWVVLPERRRGRGLVFLTTCCGNAGHGTGS